MILVLRNGEEAKSFCSDDEGENMALNWTLKVPTVMRAYLRFTDPYQDFHVISRHHLFVAVLWKRVGKKLSNGTEAISFFAFFRQKNLY